jgi:DNA processing protein
MTLHLAPKNIKLAHYLRLIKAPGIGPKRFQKIVEIVDDIELFLKECQSFNEIILPSATKEYFQKGSWDEIESELLWAEKPHNQIITLMDEKYPRQLKTIDSPPPVLYVQGNSNILSLPQLAIVGCRNPSKTGAQTAYTFSMDLAKMGWIITSGLAYGIDAASHQGALNADGLTIAVLGSGLEHIYPKSHITLAEKIKTKGALISEFGPNTLPIAENFPRRNRIISGLSKGVIVIEAALKSGSLITARYALEQGREVFAVPSSIHHVLAKGCHSLIREGAKLVENTQHIIEELIDLNNPFFTSKIENKGESSSSEQLFCLTNKQLKLLECIDFSCTPIDLIIERGQLPVDEVNVLLVELELNGIVTQVPGGYSRAILQ